MAIILSHPLTVQEIRVLQEYRRIPTETLDVAAVKAIKHPVGGGEAPAFSLVEKGFLTTDEGRQSFVLTDKGKEFLSHDVVPEVEGGTDVPASTE